MLLEGQGDVESQAVLKASPFVGRGHDAASRTRDDHHVRARQGGTEFPGEAIQGVFHWRAC
ncbi:hypothetical protein D3C73_1496510 [compost metagenome]